MSATANRLRQTRWLLFLLIAPSFPATGLNAQERQITVTGLVRDAGSGRPVVAATVVFDSLVVAATNETGEYEAQALSVSGSTIMLEFRRIGYAALEQEIELPDTGSTVRVDVTLLPSPTDVEQIVVQGERVAVANPGLVGFYERREQGFGTYLTGDEIARIGGTDLQPHLRRLRLHYGLDRSINPFAGGRASFPDACFVAYLDGVRLLDLSAINEWIPASSLGGIELHRPEELSHLPGEFVPPLHAGCEQNFRVLMFWSKIQREPSPFELGVQFGALVNRSADRGQYLGVKFITPVRTGYSTVRLHLDVNVRIRGHGNKGQALINLAMRPFGNGSPLYAGTGFGLVKRDDDQNAESLSAHHTLLTGLSCSVLGTRLFAELQVFDPLKPGSSSMLLLVGMRYRHGF